MSFQTTQNQLCLGQNNTNGGENTSPPKPFELYFFVPRCCYVQRRQILEENLANLGQG